LAAPRTPGGHYRIQERDLAALLSPGVLAPSGIEAPEASQRPLRCWEYLNRPGVVRDECRKCVVYQVRAAWCFRVATNLGCDLGEKTSFCTSSCEDCTYDRRVSGQATSELVISTDNDPVSALGSTTDASVVDPSELHTRHPL